MGVSQPLRLLVDTRLHSEELARFETNVVRGPHRDDCAIWVGAIGGTATAGFGYAAVAASGSWCAPTAMPWPPPRTGWHWNRRCAHCTGATRFAYGSACRGRRVCCTWTAEPQRDNMEMMGRARRGGGRPAVRRGIAGLAQRRARAAALPEMSLAGRAAAGVGWALGRLGCDPC